MYRSFEKTIYFAGPICQVNILRKRKEIGNTEMGHLEHGKSRSMPKVPLFIIRKGDRIAKWPLIPSNLRVDTVPSLPRTKQFPNWAERKDKFPGILGKPSRLSSLSSGDQFYAFHFQLSLRERTRRTQRGRNEGKRFPIFWTFRPEHIWWIERYPESWCWT